MKIGKRWVLIVALSLSIIIISACSPTRIPVDEYELPPHLQVTITPEAVEEELEEPLASEGEESAPVEVEQEGDNLDDVPIMDIGYEIQRGRTGKNVVYQVDSTIDEVVAWYQEELPNYDWELAGPPDNAVASIATMLRENADGDRLAINMQRNELGGFVRITITIARAD